LSPGEDTVSGPLAFRWPGRRIVANDESSQTSRAARARRGPILVGLEGIGNTMFEDLVEGEGRSIEPTTEGLPFVRPRTSPTRDGYVYLLERRGEVGKPVPLVFVF
jgi:hypothetical protein